MFMYACRQHAQLRINRLHMCTVYILEESYRWYVPMHICCCANINVQCCAMTLFHYVCDVDRDILCGHILIILWCVSV